MKSWICSCLPLVLFSQTVPSRPASIVAAAANYVPGVSWRAKSVVSGDFTCSGRVERAILGTSRSEIVIAVFLSGTDKPPEVLRYSAEARDPASARLATESLDYSPKEELGSDLPGFQRSKRCKGLNLSDGKIDSAHIYWDHESHRFEDWVR